MKTIEPTELESLNDPRLERLIRAPDASSRAEEIERLVVSLARPLAEQIVSRYRREDSTIGPQDAEDILATVSLRVVRKLTAVSDSADEAIRHFDDYVATLTYNTVNDHLRSRYPERNRLKNRLRYVLTRDPRLALWTSAAGLTAGLAAWKDSSDVLLKSPLDASAATREMARRERPADAVAAILRAAGKPIPFEALVAFAAEIWQIADITLVPLDCVLANATPAALPDLESREMLRALWREVRLLPLAQRKALLLNLRDAETMNVMALFVFTGMARFEELAATMEMSAEALAALWSDLPLDDLRIAEMLGISRQRVINLRKAARERLGRRVFSRKR